MGAGKGEKPSWPREGSRKRIPAALRMDKPGLGLGLPSLRVTEATWMCQLLPGVLLTQLSEVCGERGCEGRRGEGVLFSSI